MANTCVARDCKNIGHHMFPKDEYLRQRWEDAIEVFDFKATEYHSLCYDHFKKEDYLKIGSIHSREHLKNNAVPSIFKHKNNKKFIKTYGAKRKCTTQESVSSEDSVVQINVKEPVTFTDAATQKNFNFFSIDRFKENYKAIEYYTGFVNYEEFTYILHTVCPKGFYIKPKYAQIKILNLEDGFFLTMIKLKQSKPDFELALLFDITIENVFRLFETWLNFMYDVWSQQHLPHKNLMYITMLNDVSRMGVTEVKGINIKCVPEFLKKKNLLDGYAHRHTKKNRWQVNTEESPIKMKGFRILIQPMNRKYLPLWSKIYFACCILCGYKDGRTLKKI